MSKCAPGRYKHSVGAALAAWLIVLASGCATLNPEIEGSSSIFTSSSDGSTSIAPVDLIRLLDTTGKLALSTSASVQEQRGALDSAFRAFYRNTKVDSQAHERDRIQDRLVLTSNELCRDYKARLVGRKAGYNTYLGSLAILFGAAGAVSNAADAARNYAAAAGAAGGIRGEINANQFGDKTIGVILQGIEAARLARYRAMMTSRFGNPEGSGLSRAIGEYTVELAIADAVQFHDACSLVAGLASIQEAQQTVNLLTGTETFKKIFETVKKLRE